jgi:HAD superfamily hydrolase (TIGR01549 family)
MPRVVTFDAGQTLVELDLDFLAKRAAMCDVVVEREALAAAAPAAWRHYNAVVRAAELDHPAMWRELIAHMLAGAHATGDVAAAAAWLYDQQPKANLFRKPIAPMVALARGLAAAGTRVAVVSNSDGGVAELLAEVGLADAFEVIVDSGRVGIAKPDPRIFAIALDTLGLADVARDDCVHIGDSWEADVLGAHAAGFRAIWARSPLDVVEVVDRARDGLTLLGNVVPQWFR